MYCNNRTEYVRREETKKKRKTAPLQTRLLSNSSSVKSPSPPLSASISPPPFCPTCILVATGVVTSLPSESCLLGGPPLANGAVSSRSPPPCAREGDGGGAAGTIVPEREGRVVWFEEAVEEVDERE